MCFLIYEMLRPGGRTKTPRNKFVLEWSIIPQNKLGPTNLEVVINSTFLLQTLVAV